MNNDSKNKYGYSLVLSFSLSRPRGGLPGGETNGELSDSFYRPTGLGSSPRVRLFHVFPLVLEMLLEEHPQPLLVGNDVA